VKLLSSFLYAVLVVLLLFAGSGEAAAQENLVNLTTSVIGGGSIVRDPDQTFYEIGTTVSLTAIADEGFVFQAWSGPVADPLSDNTTILMKSNTLVGATFVPSSKPQLKTSPEAGTPLDFGVVETGLLSITSVRTITVTNVGGGTLEGTAAVRAGTSRPYGVLSGESFSLAPNQSAEVRVIFDPFNVDLNLGGVTISDVLLVTSNGGSAEIPLTGVAIASSELVCSCASVAPGGKRWGDTLLLLAVLGILAVVRRSPALAPAR
jgi:MYXO-CTERM domain-containing protein